MGTWIIIILFFFILFSLLYLVFVAPGPSQAVAGDPRENPTRCRLSRVFLDAAHGSVMTLLEAAYLTLAW